eukprot:273191_1
MSISALFILDQKGKVLISRNYKGDVSMSAADKYVQEMNKQESFLMSPITSIEGITYACIAHENLYLMGATKRNSNAMLMISFLYSCVKVFEGYFKKLEEESIRDNFVIIYELLDEMMDFGFPQSTEEKILKDYICVMEKHIVDVRPPTAVTNVVSWRAEGIKHKKNEVFLDVVEKLNLLVSNNGTVLHSEILGCLKMKSYLSGMPELKLGLNDKLVLQQRQRRLGSRVKMVEMDDIRFHQCVRLARFENDRTISFIPPDGEFELMSYRLDTKVRPLIWIEAHVEPHSHSRIEYMIKAKSEFKRRSTANNVEIYIPVPPDCDSPSFKASIGTVKYVPEDNAIMWSIKQFHGQKEYLMRAHFGLPSISQEETKVEKPPIRVKFEIPYFTVSGIQVRYLKIIDKSGYAALPWVRYITQNGDYQLRMAV